MFMQGKGNCSSVLVVFVYVIFCIKNRQEIMATLETDTYYSLGEMSSSTNCATIAWYKFDLSSALQVSNMELQLDME